MELVKILFVLFFSLCSFCFKNVESLLFRLDETSKPLFTGLQYGSFYKGPVCQPSTRIRHPKSVPEVIGIIHEAIRNGKNVKALGAQHSATDIICTGGIPVSMVNIKSLTMNADNTVLIAGAGATLFRITKYLRTVGRGLISMPAFGNLTIGGAIGTGAHGSTLKFTASLSDQVVGIEFIDGYGVLRTVTDSGNLKALKVHLGLLGIITKVMMRTVPLYKVLAHNYVVSDNIVFNGALIEMAKTTDGIEAFWFPQFQKVVIANITMISPKNSGNAWTHEIPSTTSAFNFMGAPLLDGLQAADSYMGLNAFQAFELSTLFQTTPGFIPIHTQDGFRVINPAIGYYDDLYLSTCQSTGNYQCAWLHGPNNLTLTDSEMSIPLMSLPIVALKVADILSKYPATFAAKGVILRFSKGTNTLMSLSQGRDSCHFEFFMYTRKDQYRTASSGLAAYQTILQTLAHEFNGRSHWGKSGLYYHSRDLINLKLNPVSKKNFIAKMNEFDPYGIFMNDFGRRLLGIGTKMNIDPETIHCALLDNCVCRRNIDCAPGQVCSTLVGYNKYPACLTPGHSLEILNPIPFISQGSLAV